MSGSRSLRDRVNALRDHGDEHSADPATQGDGKTIRAGMNGITAHIRTMIISISPLTAIVTLATLAIVDVSWWRKGLQRE